MLKTWYWAMALMASSIWGEGYASRKVNLFILRVIHNHPSFAIVIMSNNDLDPPWWPTWFNYVFTE